MNFLTPVGTTSLSWFLGARPDHAWVEFHVLVLLESQCCYFSKFSFCTGKGLECFSLGLWQSCSSWIQAGYNFLPDSHWTLLFGQWFDYQEYRQSQNVSNSHSPAIRQYLFTHLAGKNSHVQIFLKTSQWCSKAKINFGLAICCFP